MSVDYYLFLDIINKIDYMKIMEDNEKLSYSYLHFEKDLNDAIEKYSKF